MASSERKIGKKARSGGAVSKVYWVLGIAAILGVAIVGYSVGSAGGSEMATALIPEIANLEDNAAIQEMAQGVVRGEEDAPITIVEFGDYQCPACGGWAALVEPQVKSAFIETGEAEFVFYDFPLEQHPHAFLAARAARCAGDQDGYWPYHDALFVHQSTWSSSARPASLFIDYAGQVGLDQAVFEQCLRSDRHAEVVSANVALGRRLGVSGTPTIMVSAGTGLAERVDNSFAALSAGVAELKASLGLTAPADSASESPGTEGSGG